MALSREIVPPVRGKDLAPLEPDCPGVFLPTPLSPKEYRKVAALLEEHPDNYLHVWGPGNLDFLQYFPKQRRFACDIDQLDSLEGLQYLQECRYLSIYRAAKGTSLAPIAGMPKLETLLLGGQYHDHHSLTGMTWLRSLGLIYAAQTKTLDWLPPNLHEFTMDVGSIRDISGLAAHPNIAEISFHKTRLLADLTPLSANTGLRTLHLSQLSSVTELFDFTGLQNLRELHIKTLRKLTDTRPLLAAKNLTELFLYDLPALDPQAWHDTCTGWLAQNKPPFW
ncbi:hypothetical protein [[Mycobacterium] wendilense]|uniref:Leucine-rich repeat domain-containing protein n=1 Tax=[Mycobacterium] wendilense TaxID=3064284 RepID=A0ABN9P5K0_9MYCO|nr:hypothetical protein [Mycolicibacterium sp. MU0050]CAJ1587603.1 hypothetical protein MU0050_004888 [Mycolicibacterium sp. MU0050]